MNKYKIAFTMREYGSIEIEAENEKDARDTFYESDYYSETHDSEVDIDEIECLTKVKQVKIGDE